MSDLRTVFLDSQDNWDFTSPEFLQAVSDFQKQEPDLMQAVSTIALELNRLIEERRSNIYADDGRVVASRVKYSKSLKAVLDDEDTIILTRPESFFYNYKTYFAILRNLANKLEGCKIPELAGIAEALKTIINWAKPKQTGYVSKDTEQNVRAGGSTGVSYYHDGAQRTTYAHDIQ